MRMVREMTGLEVTIVEELINFIQEGTPTGTMNAHGYIARVTGGTLRDDGSEGPARVYRLDALPAIIPIRVANQRVLDAYLEWHRTDPGPVRPAPRRWSSAREQARDWSAG